MQAVVHLADVFQIILGPPSLMRCASRRPGYDLQRDASPKLHQD
jgi:hypothetical protein